MALFRQAMAVAWLVAAAVLNHVDVASAQQLSASDVCTNGLPASQGCMRVNNDWNTFRSSINAAVQGDAIRYCPFLITNVNGLPATPTVRAAFACSVPGACVIRGSGRHILVQDANSDNLFYGFVFQNATDTAIRVAANATKTVLICHSFFQGYVLIFWIQYDVTRYKLVVIDIHNTSSWLVSALLYVFGISQQLGPSRRSYPNRSIIQCIRPEMHLSGKQCKGRWRHLQPW